MRVSIFTNVRSANVAKAEDRRLLRVLFLRIGRLSARSRTARLLSLVRAYSFLIRPDGRPGILRYEGIACVRRQTSAHAIATRLRRKLTMAAIDTYDAVVLAAARRENRSRGISAVAANASWS